MPTIVKRIEAGRLPPEARGEIDDHEPVEVSVTPVPGR